MELYCGIDLHSTNHMVTILDEVDRRVFERRLAAAQRVYQRKARERNAIVAMKALAHKLARACYHVLRDEVAFEPARLFSH